MPLFRTFGIVELGIGIFGAVSLFTISSGFDQSAQIRIGWVEYDLELTLHESGLVQVLLTLWMQYSHHPKDPVAVSIIRLDGDAFGPRLFIRHDIPETKLEWKPGSQLPGGIVAL